MARVVLSISDPAHRLTLKAMLEAAGHHIVDDAPDVRVIDVSAPLDGAAVPTVLLTPVAEIPVAVRAMERGAFGYILVPLQPGEAPLMVTRANARAAGYSAADEGGAKTLEEVEHAHILETLRRCKHNQAKAARVLGIGRNTLWRKLKRIREKDDHAS